MTINFQIPTTKTESAAAQEPFYSPGVGGGGAVRSTHMSRERAGLGQQQQQQR